MPASTLVICPSMFDPKSHKYNGPDISSWEGDLCFSASLFGSSPSYVIPGDVKASHNICFATGGAEGMVTYPDNQYVIMNLTIAGSVTAGASVSFDCECGECP